MWVTRKPSDSIHSRTVSGGAAPAVIISTPGFIGNLSDAGAWMRVFKTTGAAQKCVTLCFAMEEYMPFAVTYIHKNIFVLHPSIKKKKKKKIGDEISPLIEKQILPSGYARS